MKIVICGGSGQLGRDCTQVLEGRYDVISLSSQQIDITDPAKVEKVIGEVKPRVVINCAAYTKVDACETEQELCWKINAEGPENIAIASQRHGALLVHASTDYIFDGSKHPPEPYVEDDPPHPLSYYGKTKLEGEKAIQGVINRHIIVRTAWLYGAHGHNFLKTMLRIATNHPAKEIKVVNDQFGSPTWSYTLAKQIEKLIEVNGQGIYHATAEDYCTWYELARAFFQKMGVPHLLTPCSTEEYPTPAVRPKNSILGNSHLQRQGINLMRDWHDDLNEYVFRFRRDLLNGARGV